MNGIDISGWQKGINLEKVACDFVIIKATQGTTIVSNDFKRQIEQALSLGKKVGVYHYAGGGGADAEAIHFINTVKPYLGKAILVIDWEGAQNPNFKDKSYVINMLAKVKAISGVTPFIYMSKSVCRAYDWSSIAKEVPLWCAEYANNNPTGYQENPWTDSKGFGAWSGPAIYQYSSHGRLNGWSGNLDLDKAYISAAEWDARASIEGADIKIKTLEELAQEVLEGKWGNGVDRKNRLTAAGYDYAAVQHIVNGLASKPATAPAQPKKKTVTEIAKEVIQGKWGNGAARKKALTAAGYDYATVQKKVDELMKKK